MEWALSNLVVLREELGDRWPDCADDLTLEIAFGLRMAEGMYSLASPGKGEAKRREMNEAVADLFDQVDFVICRHQPRRGVRRRNHPARHVDGVNVGAENDGVLTQPANISGVPGDQHPGRAASAACPSGCR